MNPSKIQIVFFFDKIIERPDLVIKPLVEEEYKEKLDVMPQIVPMPQNVPAEIPRVLMTSSKNDFKVSIALNKLDIEYIGEVSQGHKIVNGIIEKEATEFSIKTYNDEDISKIKDNACKLAEKLENTVGVVRIGIIGVFLQIRNDAVSKIKNKFFNDEVSGSSELSLRYNKQNVHEDIIFNDILQIESMDNTINLNTQDGIQTVSSKGVQIVRDYNNVPKIGALLTAAQMKNLLETGLDKITEAKIREVWADE